MEQALIENSVSSELNADVHTELACHYNEATLDSLTELAIHIDNLLQDRCHQPNSVSSGLLVSEPMQLCNTHLAPLEHLQHRRNGLCFYCGRNDHHIIQRTQSFILMSGQQRGSF